ncbi:hypothetical protein [Aureimonas pseudogalii]|uniref:Transposase (putative) YhgA-like domain-containing protein n=1 Tax=Aureimonas pseudogalii TaxID=1744844 RepID=A0A7W6EHM6_9HYPH|nr:hypothetical protein [Aureimonas pseudogalii]MBB3998369.1 hypothetical protein [Aureimonas pseudogalii]
MSQSNPRFERMQPQWDALFKSLVPWSSAIRRTAETALELEKGDLIVEQPLQTDISSTVVASALGWSSPYKDLRADGLFIVRNGKSILSIEYQSTHNPGMRLRFAMYMEAFLEATEKKHVDKNWHHVLVYSGSKKKRHYQNLHGRRDLGYIDYAVVDIERIEREQFATGLVADAILRLSLRDAKDFKLFKDALDLLERDVSDADAKAKLKKAVLAASMNKADLWPTVWGIIMMDETFLREVESFIPFFDELRAHHERELRLIQLRQLLEALVTVGNAPLALRSFVAKASADDIETHAESIREAALGNTLVDLTSILVNDGQTNAKSLAP